jgi:LysM repeat protein
MMKIHIKKSDESMADIAESYGIDEARLRRINEIPHGECASGEELLILTPTRSYRVQAGDTLDRISLRFGVRKKDLLCRNPWLSDKGLRVGEGIAVKCDDQTGGMAVANGYFYPGCSESLLMRAMPFLTYISFCSAVADKRGVSRIANDKKEVALASEEKKIPLLRVYDRYCDRYKSGGEMSGFAEELIEAATVGGYKGLVIDSCPLSDSAEEFASFMMILRKLMIGCDLILITEINDKSPTEFSEYADGSIMYYPKFAVENPTSFCDGERKILADFACEGESAKAFIDLPSLAKIGEKYISYGDALKIARSGNCSIDHNENTLLSHYRDRKQGDCVFSSLSAIKALLDMTRELDYMGISFDIMRTPLSHMMMYNAMFKTSYFNSVRTREGCSRADGE